MTTAHTEDSYEDGNLPEARRKLATAISALIDPKPHTLKRQYEDGTSVDVEWIDSLYDQLSDAVPGGQGNASRVPQSSPPMCIDAVDIMRDIDTSTAEWEPRPEIDVSAATPPIAVIRLQAIDKRTWRPQDTNLVEKIAGEIESWCEKIRALLDPVKRWTLPNPCPACDTAVVYRRNSSDEIVRQPALQIGPAGCVCQNCHHNWAPEYFQHLAQVLGYELPQGILE
ncbi:hypothetical protein H8Z60_19940 [Mycolicibacterium fortuitum]|nr:hypothetical protein [Mycolicibacterium fortuitum]